MEARALTESGIARDFILCSKPVDVRHDASRPTILTCPGNNVYTLRGTAALHLHGSIGVRTQAYSGPARLQT